MSNEGSGWRKASHSNGSGNCVEVSSAECVAVRDTKDRGGVTLTVPAAAWTAFISTLR